MTQRLALPAAIATAAAIATGMGAGGGQAAGRCSGDAAKALVRKFAGSYSSGRVALINRMWAREPRFRWFSSGAPGARLGPPAYERATLATYFRARVRLHERIRITQLRARYDPTRKIVNFSGKLVRRADDMRRRPPTDFKGAADCVSGGPTLIVWSM